MLGGIENHCQELYPRLVKKGCNVVVLARKGYVRETLYSYLGVQVKPLWAPRVKSIEAFLHTFLGVFWVLAHKEKFDIVHIHAIGPSLFSYFVRRLGFKLVTTNHGPDYDRKKWGLFAKSVLKKGEKIGAKNSNIVIAVSKNIKKRLSEKFNQNIVYIPNGVNIPNPEPASSTLKKFGLVSGHYFLSVGRLVPEKGFHDLIEAFRQIQTDWQLVIVGDADHEDKYSIDLKNATAKIRNVVLTGFQTGKALSEIYSNAGLFILPSYHEGLPIVALEAMSYRLPILLSDIDANKECAFPGEIFEVGNVAELRKRMENFLFEHNQNNHSEIINKKMKLLNSVYNWKKIADKTYTVYRDVLGDKAK